MIQVQDRSELASSARRAMLVWLVVCLVLLAHDWRFAVAFTAGSVLMSFIRGWSMASKTGFYVEDLALLLSNDKVVKFLVQTYNLKGDDADVGA